MKKRIVCLLVSVLLVAMMVAPAAASSYGEVVDTTGRVWEVTFSGEGSLTSMRLSAADRLAALTSALYPFFEMEQRLESLSSMPESVDYYVQLQAVEPLRKLLLQFYPGEFTLITQSDPKTVVGFATEQLNSEGGKALKEAMIPLETHTDSLDFRTVDDLRFVYADEKLNQIYDSLEEVLTTYYGDTTFIQLLESMKTVTFGGFVEVPARPVRPVQNPKPTEPVPPTQYPIP